MASGMHTTTKQNFFLETLNDLTKLEIYYRGRPAALFFQRRPGRPRPEFQRPRAARGRVFSKNWKTLNKVGTYIFKVVFLI